MSANSTPPPEQQQQPQVKHTTPSSDPAPWHGYACSAEDWALPKCVCSTTELARPKYSDQDASEYQDSPAVLKAKVQRLATLIKSAQNFCVYTGAGLSTAAGIGDYASRASGSVVGRNEGSGSRLSLQPTKSHRVLAALEKSGHLKFWLQQNHDGLAQKAGYPLKKLNEIHGTWWDTKHNPVVLMDGCVRKDLREWMMEWAAKSDLCIAMGTSLCGMSADVVAEQTALRHQTGGLGQGLVIINLQRTPYDEHASLRIFAKTDEVFTMLQQAMKLKLDTQTYDAHAPPMALAKLAKEREQEKKAAAERQRLAAQAKAKRSNEAEDDAA